MTRIYTRTGDQGNTGLADGTRTTKTSARIEAIGTVDECNSHLGMLISLVDDTTLATKLSLIQHQLFDLGATLAGAPKQLIQAHHVEMLEGWIDQLEQALPPLKQFILPGGGIAIAQAHVTRAVCRRAERCTFKIMATETLPEPVIQFLNRLSDYLFMVARALSSHQGDDKAREIPWLPEDKRG